MKFSTAITRLKRNLLTVLMLIVSMVCIAQIDSVNQISVLARPSLDSIVLRWAPINVDAWIRGIKSGYTVERYTMVRDSRIVNPSERWQLTEAPILPWTESRWESLVQNNKYAAIAAQALFGSEFEMSLEGTDVFQIVNKVQENEMRFSFALYAADLSVPVSMALGLRITDKDVKKGEKYLYRILSVHEGDTIRGSIFLGPEEYELPAPIDFAAEFKGNVVSLKWDQSYHRGIYTAYIIERAEDSKKFEPISGGVTYIVVPKTQSNAFETSVLKLHSISSGTVHIDLVNTIRAANLNTDNKLDITEYGSGGGLSPVFEINHDGEKLKLMVAYPLLGNKKNKIDPSKRPDPVTGQTDNAMGKAGKWVLYEFENSKGTGQGHNTKIYVMAAQMELFESYLLIAQEVLITGINWRSQVDSYFENEGCYNTNDGNVCCRKACDVIIEQFGVQTNRSHSIDIAVLTSPDTDYNSLSVTNDFESGLEYLKTTIKPNQQGGKPVLVGVHYNRGKKPFNSNKATYHFIVIVGKGYDIQARKHYFRFYDVNTSNRSEAISESNKLYIDETQRLIRGARGNGRTYTITEVRQNF